ncbi:hypothetical protein, partial [Vibrio aestuarianus]|nr:hypothetical protein [Vibrio aestuarianus]
FKWILNAWQFYYASGKVFYGVMQRLGQCVVHHLIGRYVLSMLKVSASHLNRFYPTYFVTIG